MFRVSVSRPGETAEEKTGERSEGDPNLSPSDPLKRSPHFRTGSSGQWYGTSAASPEVVFPIEFGLLLSIWSQDMLRIPLWPAKPDLANPDWMWGKIRILILAGTSSPEKKTPILENIVCKSGRDKKGKGLGIKYGKRIGEKSLQGKGISGRRGLRKSG